MILPTLRLTLLAVATTAMLGMSCAGRTTSQPSPEPKLCDLEDGKWCEPCDGNQCEQASKSGWLCCSGTVCVAVQTIDECGGGTVGWCQNYTEQQQCNENGWCTDVATCHDE